MDLFVDHISYSVTTLGPGLRIVLWVQGCSLRCAGCMSTELFERQKDSRFRVTQVAEMIIARASGHAGITISGGEPFEQAEALTELLKNLRHNTSLDIMIYSGYTRKEILESTPAKVELLSLADILVDGPYQGDLPPSKPWCGSDNQGIHLLSNRAQTYAKYVGSKIKITTTLQVEMTAEKEVRVIGILRRGEIDQLKNQLSKRGIELKK